MVMNPLAQNIIAQSLGGLINAEPEIDNQTTALAQLAAYGVPGAGQAFAGRLAGQISPEEARAFQIQEQQLAQQEAARAKNLDLKERSLQEQIAQRELDRQLREREFGLKERGLEADIIAQRQKTAVQQRQQARLEREEQQRAKILETISAGKDFGVQTVDLVEEAAPKQQIADFKAKNKALSAGLLDPELKDFAKAQIEANNEEIKNLRQLEKEKRKLEEGLSPEQAAKASMVQKGIKDVDTAIDILTGEGTDDITFFEALSASNLSVGTPFGIIGDIGFKGGLPATNGRRVRALLLNAVNAQLRAESGAAVPESEVERAAQRFLPSPLDDAPTRKAKLEGLKEQLQATLSLTKGPAQVREGAAPITQQTTQAPQAQSIDPALLEFMTPEERALFQ